MLFLNKFVASKISEETNARMIGAIHAMPDRWPNTSFFIRAAIERQLRLYESGDLENDINQ